MNIDYSPFENAIGQLEKSLSFYNSDLARENLELKLQFRAAAIQAFEFTYELAIKMIRRQLGRIVASPSELKEMAFMDFIRTAFEAGIVRDVMPFRLYRDRRNITSHTYDAAKADDILTIMVDFVRDMHFILDELKRRNG